MLIKETFFSNPCESVQSASKNKIKNSKFIIIISETIENGTLDVPANVPANERQKWFLKQIGKNIRVSSSDIAAHWGVSQKTAKRDIADLKQKGLIEFLGAPKSGYYCLKS